MNPEEVVLVLYDLPLGDNSIAKLNSVAISKGTHTDMESSEFQGFGAFHTGVQVLGKEVNFTPEGLYQACIGRHSDRGNTHDCSFLWWPCSVSAFYGCDHKTSTRGSHHPC